MLNAKPSSPGFLIVTLTLGILATFAMPMRGQDRNSRPEGKEEPAGFAEDWSHHHVVFSNPGSADEAMRKGKYDEWFRIVNNPRYETQEGSRRLRERHAREGRRNDSGGLKTDWSMSLGAGATVGAGQYPVKYHFGTTTAGCNDWVAFNTSVTGSASQPNIEAYDNLYETTCSGSVPMVYWSYFTGTGKALTSAAVSFDGSKVAFVENSATGAVLRILAWKAGQGTPTLPAAPDHPYTNTNAGNVANKAWNTTNCPTGSSCMISVAFQNGKQDLISSPFYDFNNDTLWVGDASGNLHEFTGVFLGTPGEVTTNWPIAVSAKALTSPTFDSGTSQNIFVGDAGGFLYSYKAASAAHEMTSSQLTYASTTAGIVDAPIVDSTTEQVYVSVGQDAELTGGTNLNVCVWTAGTGFGCSGIFQFPAANTTTGTGVCNTTSATSWTGGTNCGHEAVFGVGTYPGMYDGSFDETYFTGTGVSGNLWACVPANSSGHTVPTPRLAVIAIQASGGIVPTGDVISAADVTSPIASLTSNTVLATTPTCSPVTEFYNTGNATPVTTTSATISAATTSVSVGSNTNIAIGNYIEINSEIMLVSAKPTGTTLTVARGQIGTAAAAHPTVPTNVTIPAVDYIYFSVTNLGIAASAISNCASGACLYSYPVGTASGTPATFAAAPTNGEPQPGGTSGIIIDNSTTAAGESQIYFTPLSNGTCLGNGSVGNGTTVGCAIQTSQSAP